MVVVLKVNNAFIPALVFRVVNSNKLYGNVATISHTIDECEEVTLFPGKYLLPNTTLRSGSIDWEAMVWVGEITSNSASNAWVATSPQLWLFSHLLVYVYTDAHQDILVPGNFWLLIAGLNECIIMALGNVLWFFTSANVLEGHYRKEALNREMVSSHSDLE